MQVRRTDHVSRADRFTKIVFGCVIVSIVAFAGFVLSTDQYYKREFFDGVTALSNTNEAFVFLQVNKTVEKVRTWNLLLARCFGILTSDNPETKKNLIVFHWDGSSLNQYHQDDFDMAGQLVPLDNTVYLIQGGYSVSVFAWKGSHFVSADSQETNRIMSLIKAHKSLLEKSAWNRLDWETLGSIGDGYDKTFPLKTPDTILHIKTGAPILNGRGYVTHYPKVQIELLIKGQRSVLLDLSQDYTKVSAQEMGQPLKKLHSLARIPRLRADFHCGVLTTVNEIFPFPFGSRLPP